MAMVASVVCRYCGKPYFPVCGCELPTACPYCDVADTEFTLWWMEPLKDERRTLLTPFRSNDYTLLLKRFRISPEGL